MVFINLLQTPGGAIDATLCQRAPFGADKEIEFTQETLKDLSAATSREWLETNGLGGFSSSTVIGLNTRRFDQTKSDLHDQFKELYVSQEQAEKILQVVERELLTARGLRTLSPSDPQYRGRYEGNPSSRDTVYHQGTVWPWLMGPYITAYVKTFGVKAGRAATAEWLGNFEEHLGEACLGQVSEIFDGDAPHTPRGCVGQAWTSHSFNRFLTTSLLVKSIPSTGIPSA